LNKIIMKKSDFFIGKIVTGFAVCVVAACSATTENQETSLTALTSMERIGQDQKPFGASRAVIKAPKNEVESFQVVVNALQKNIRLVKAEMSDLAGNGGTIGKEYIALFREDYVRVRRPSGRTQLPPNRYLGSAGASINTEAGKPIEPFSQDREKVW
jgi:hypothetical protein